MRTTVFLFLFILPLLGGGLADLSVGELKTRSENGDVPAMVELATRTFDGQVMRDRKSAKHCFLIAAKENHAGALVSLGDMAMADGGWDGDKGARQKGAERYREAAARNSAEGMRKLALMQIRDTLVRKPGEDWYQLLLDADSLGDRTATRELARINYHAPGYLFRDLDWTKTAYYDEKCIRDAGGYDEGHTSTHQLLEIYYEGGHGLDRDFKKCLALAQPLLSDCEIANAYAGRVLLNRDLPMGASRELIVRGYACLLHSRALRVPRPGDVGLFRISDEALFVLRSRHGMTRAEVARAERLVRDGFPNSATPLLP